MSRISISIWVIFAVLLVVVAVASFYAGALNRSPFDIGTIERQVEGLAAGATQLFGQVESNEQGILTVRLQDNTTRTAFVAPSTPIVTSVVAADDSALTPGANVSVFGMVNENGVVTAKYITIVPATQ